MKDFLLDEDGDLIVGEDGRFVIGECDEQNVRLNIESSKTQWRETPQAGFGIVRYRNKSISEKDKFIAEIQAELTADGYSITRLDFLEGFKDFELDFERT